MRRAIQSILSAAATLVALVASPAIAQQQVENPGDPWIHVATATPFPARMGSFLRGRVTEFSQDGADVGVSYHIARGTDILTVTLYVYPADERSCDAEFQDVKQSVLGHPGAKLASEVRRPAPLGTGEPVARLDSFTAPADSFGKGLPAVRSDAYLHCPAGDKWRVKYRATWTQTADFSAEVDTLLHSIRWPESIGR